MNTISQLKKINVAVQFSDGSVSFLIFPIYRKGLVFESDFKSVYSKSVNISVENNNTKFLNSYKKLFKKIKTLNKSII